MANPDPACPSAAEHARTVAASTNVATLASLTTAGDPWASLVAYGLLNGAPVLCLTQMAEHSRNIAHDSRASLSIVGVSTDPDPLANARVTLAGRIETPHERTAAREAFLAAVPAAQAYVDYDDFTLWTMRVDRVRWVGGYAHADSATGEEYLRAEPDPVAPHAARAIDHLNADHADALVAMAQTLGGYPDATAASCTAADRYGLDLRVTTARGIAYTRVGYAERIDGMDQLRSAAVELTLRARAGR